MSDIPNDENNPLNDAVENSVTPEANSENGSSGSNNQQSTTTNTAATGADTVNSQIAEAEQDLSGSNTEGESADEGVASGGEEEASPDAVQSSDAQSNIVDSQLESDEPSDGEDTAGLSEEATASALQAVGIQSVGGNDIAAALQNPDFAQAAQGIAQDLLDSNISVDDALTQLEEALNDNDPDTETTTENFDVIVEEATDQVAAEGEDFDTKTVSETFQMDVTSVNDDPEVGSAIELTMQEDDSLLVTQQLLLANSSDVDGDTLTALNLQTANPELTITDNGDGTFTLTPAANFNGDLDISFDVFDGEATVAANIDLTVNPVNDLPVAQDQNFQMNEDGTITLTDGDLLTGASDVDGDTLSISDVAYTGTDGIFTDNGDDTYTFAPNENFNGNVTVDFTVSDGQGGTDTAQANIVVVPVNDPPVAGDTSFSMNEDGTITLTPAQLLANSSDVEGDVSLQGVSYSGSDGTLSENDDGSFSFIPNENFNGDIVLDVVVLDAEGTSDTAQANIVVVPVNDAPQAGNVGTLTTNEDNSIEIDPDYILGFASDVDGDDLSLASLTLRDPNHGTLTQNAQTGVYSFSPAANFAGAVALDYLINDGTVDTAGSMEVNVIPVNDAAFVDGNSHATVMEDGQITFNADDLLNLFGDVDGDNLTISNVIIADGDEAEGQVVANGDGTFTFTPEDDFAGTTQMQVIVSDGTVETAMDMPVYVRPVADGAVITKSQDGPIVMNEDETGFLSLSVDLLDASESLTSLVMTGYPLGFTISDGEHSVTITEEGQLILINDWDISNISIDPPQNWHGTFEVTLTATTVDYGDENSNALPDSSDITGDFDATEGQDLIITELDLLDMAENIQVQDGDEPGFVHLINNSQGALVDNGDGTWTFSPADGFTGEVDFAYVIQRDGELFDEQSSIGVQPAVPGADNGLEIEGIATTDIDKGNSVEFTDADLLAQINGVDGNDLSITGVQITDGVGVLRQSSDGTYTYTPDSDFSGEAQISFVASDDLNSVTSFVNVNVINAAPEVVAVDQASDYTVAEDGSITFTESELLTAVGATDADGDTMTVEGLGVQPDSGTVINNGDGSWTVWPDSDFGGNMELTYMVNDGTYSTPATVLLTVTPENDVPTESTPLYVEMNMNGTTTLTLDELLANVTDVDGDTLSVSNFQSDNATVTDNGDDSYSIVADGDFQGTAGITYDVSDGTETIQASISANVSPAEDGQVDGEAADYTVSPGGSLNIAMPSSISEDDSVDHVIASDLPDGATISNGLEDNDGNYVISGDLSQPIQVSLGDGFEGDVSINVIGYDALDQTVDGASEIISIEVDDAYAAQGSSADGANVNAGSADQGGGDWTNADNTNAGVDVMDDSSSFDNANDNNGSNDDMSDLGGIG